jgi:MFS family permease
VRKVLLLASAIVFVDTMFFAALTPLLPHYADRFALSKAGAGILQAAYPIGVLVGGVPSGFLTARIGPKVTASIGATLVAATSVTFGFAGSVALLDTARLVQGVGSACAWTAVLSWLVAVTPASRRGETIGRAMGVAIGGATFGPVVGAVASVAGTAETFTAVAVLALGVVGWTLTTEGGGRVEAQPIRQLRDALREPRIGLGLWLIALPGLLFGTTSVLVPLRLSHFGLGSVAIGGIFLAAVLLEACISPVTGRLADRRGLRLPLVVGLVGSAVGAAVLPWPGSAPFLGVVVVLASAAFGAFWVPAMALLADVAEEIRLGAAWVFALMNLAWAPAQALGSAGGGGLARASADAVPYLILSGACVLTLLGLRRSSESRLPLGSLREERA